jgi:uncharacterized membrane protein
MTSGDTQPRRGRGRRRRMARPFRQLRAHPRLVIAVAIAVACYFLLPGQLEWAMRMLIAFDVGAVIFIVAIWFMMARATQADMRWRAALEDEGRNVILALAATAAVAILLAIVFELHGSKDLPPLQQGPHVALAAATIFLSWVFMNTMFAVHYAHEYYGEGEGADDAVSGGLAFPGDDVPGYSDFLYFSFVIGMTFQVADVGITAKGLRKVALVQGVLAFFFNVVVLALTINILAGMI